MDAKYWAVIITLIVALGGSIVALSISVSGPEQSPIVNQTNQTNTPPMVCGNGTFERNGTCVADPIPVCEQGEMLNTTTLFCERVPPVDNQTVPPIDNQTIPDIPPVVNDTVPTPKPTPIDNKTRTIAALGDVDCDEMVDPIKNSKPTLVLLLGDLCYDKDLKTFLTSW